MKLAVKLKNDIRSLIPSYFYQLSMQQPPVFIFQMGKVASSSIYFSIHKQYEGICIHAHSFSEYDKKREVRLLNKAFHQKGISLKVISLVREPISRNISAFFQNFERFTGFKYSQNPYSTEELSQLFLLNYRHNIPLYWFDFNMKSNLGIDVFDTPFPIEGHVVIEKENVELLILRHDLDDLKKEKIIADFIGMNNFKLINTNIGNEKLYASTYKEFKKLSLPKSYIDYMLRSKYVNHFFKNDIDKITRKWKDYSNQ